MTEQAQIHQANRREMLKLSGMGVLGGVAASALTPAKARAEAAIKIAHAMWIHGHSMQIEYPDRLASQWRAGFSITVEGKPGSSNWFHFAIPTPLIVNDVRLRADSIMLSFRTSSVDAIVRDVHVYDGSTVIAAHNNIKLTKENLFVRLMIPDRPEIWVALGVSIGVSFGVEMMDHHMEFIAAGCDFMTEKPV
jgi:hypothetical protein